MDRKTFRKEVTLVAKDIARAYHAYHAHRHRDYVFTLYGGWVNRHALYRETAAMMLNMVPKRRADGDKRTALALVRTAREALDYHRSYTQHRLNT